VVSAESRILSDMVASAIFILDARGKTLISRDFRGDLPMSAVSEFKTRVVDAENDSLLTPFVHVESKGYTFVYIRHANIYLVAATRRNSNATMLLAFLYKLVDVCTEYFRDVQEESIRDNFVIIYELLDEMMDFGYPQVSESKILREYITQDFHVLERPNSLPVAVTNAVSWRSEGVRHARNEVFLDVIEKVNVLIAGNGNVLRSEIVGKLVMKSYLSGMPNLKLGLNDKLQFDAVAETSGREPKGRAVELEDIKFHQCVRLARFENDRTITFIPPDGAFELMSYRLSTEVKPLIWVDAIIELRQTRIDYIIKARAQLKPRAVANNVKILIPVLPDVDTPHFKCSSGTSKYAPDRDILVWSLKQFKAGREAVMKGHFGLPSISKDVPRESATRRPIQVEFEVPYFTISGLQVRFLKVVEKSGYHALPWVRYITQSGDYCIRTESS
jgi:AP-1 complex subunit mu